MVNLPIYPDRSVLPGLGFNAKWSPQFFNMPTATTASGADIDLGLASEPLHNFELTYEFLHDWSDRSSKESIEFKTLMGFFLQSGGVSGRFLFDNPDDDVVVQQSVGVGDGATTTFVLQRTFGARGYTQTESVGAVNTAKQFNVYLGDTTSPVDASTYSLDLRVPKRQLLVMDSAPAPGTDVCVDMSYYYYCKFQDDTYTFEKFMERLWLLNKINIHSCRMGA